MFLSILGDQARKAIAKAFEHIEKYTCVQFTPRNYETDYVEFVKDTG